MADDWVHRVLNALLLASAALNNIVPSLTDLSKAAAAAQGLYEIIDRQPTVDALSEEGERLSSASGHIMLRGVSFSYPGRPGIKVLDNVNLAFAPGKTTAIVGPSGSGKSTILALLYRWFEPDTGTISLDGVEAKQINLQSLRSQMGFVQQEPVLFRESVYTNVAYGLERRGRGAEVGQLTENSTSQAVQEACKLAYADNFIRNLPKGYETTVGDRGDMLSGGQKQRIAIARSIVSEPPILLLDEATSALDPESERIVQKALDAASSGRTTIVVAHRLSTIRNADTIVVMRHGKVVEKGTHGELLALNGTYTRLVEAQSADEVEGRDNASCEIPGRRNNQFVPVMEEEKSMSDLEKEVSVGVHLNQAAAQDSDTTSSEPNRLSMMTCLARMLKQEPNLWPLHLANLACCIVGGSLFPCLAVAFSRAITVFQIPLPEQREDFRQQGFFWGGMFVVIAVGVMIATSGMGYFSTTSAASLATSYRSGYFAAMLRQDVAFFEATDAAEDKRAVGSEDKEVNSAGAMTSRLSTNPQRIQDLVSTNIGFIIVASVTVLGSSVLALAIVWKLALVGIAGGLVPVVFSGLVRLKLDAVSQSQRSKAYRECARFAGEAVGAMRTVSSLTLERKVLDLYTERLSLATRRMSTYNAVTSVLIGFTDSIFFAVLALLFWSGLQQVARKETSVEGFFIVFIALIFGGQSAGFLFGYTLSE
jgi:ATP-binding cassette, subfamily B (MDR/TAP), member 1